MTRVSLRRSLKRLLFALLEIGHFQVTKGASIQRENQQLRELKDNEDGLDAVFCLYIAGLFAVGAPIRCFGDRDAGYIVVPFDH